jgi:outer membrane receptor protein involved in Fe transport
MGFQYERNRLIAGVEGSFGKLESQYYQYQMGTREDYETVTGGRGPLDTEALSDRASAAVFAQYAVVTGSLRLSVGARWDGFHDRFRPEKPEAERLSIDHGALSPKAGLNLRFAGADDRSYSGHLYLSAGRSFKAPTLDQRYDQRNIPVPFPPFQIRTSNPELNPQRGTSLEMGSYQELRIGGLSSTLSLSGYQMRMTEEIDFDVNTFRYVNIGKSRHRGIEAGLQVSGNSFSGFLNYALQDARARSGENSGKRLKAIPRHSISGGSAIELLAQRLLVSGTVTHLQGMFLDDANTTRLEDYTRVDGRVLVRVMGLEVFADVRNLFGALYSSTGFPDPSGSGEAYLYPAAGRTVRFGVRSEK